MTPGGSQGPLSAELSIQQLVQALHRRGLAAQIYERDGTQYVRVSPMMSPTAGMDVSARTEEGVCRFFSEWGSLLGGDIDNVVRRVACLFGVGRPRP